MLTDCFDLKKICKGEGKKTTFELLVWSNSRVSTAIHALRGEEPVDMIFNASVICKPGC